MTAAHSRPATDRPPPRVPWTQRLAGRIGGTTGGLLLALGIVLLVVGQSAYERRAALDAALARSELLARVLEEHATRSVDTVALALTALGGTIDADDGAGLPHIGQALTQTLSGLPLLRAVAVVDGRGRVLASTRAADVGLVLEPGRLGPLPAPGDDAIGPFVQGRSLAALVQGAAPDAPAGVGFVPLLRRLGGSRSLLLVGLVNPDAIANHQQQTLGGLAASAMLGSLDRQLLAATAELPLAPGQKLPPLPAFTQYLPAQEHHSYLGAGIAAGEQVVAYRASRTRPLVVLVEQPLDVVLADWAGQTRLRMLIGAAAVLVVLLTTRAAARSRRGRERAQAEVAAREREMSIIFGSVQELIFRTDVDGRLTFLNPRWEVLSELPLHAALTRPLAELVDERSQAAVRALFAAGATDGPRRAQIAIGQGASRRLFDLGITPLVEGGRLVGFAGSAVDITERLAGQLRLREQLAFNELLFEMLPLPVAMLDLQGHYRRLNRAWADFSHRPRSAMLGQAALAALPAQEAELHHRMLAQLMRQGGTLHYEAAARSAGQLRDLAVTMALVPGRGNAPEGVLVAFVDVTESREAERAVREARDVAEEASRAKSEFIANISHELRTPLQSIIGFSELGQARGGAAPRLAAMFGDIHRAGERMLALVNDLLDVAKIESTVGTFHLERTDLRPLVREVVREFEPLLAPRRLAVAVSLGDMPLVAKVDPLRFQQVVRNVLANAVRFSPDASTLELAGELTAANEVHLSVRDHGPGIPPAELESIFEAFVQSSKTKDGSGGTGLGLAICRKILEAHGGRIQAVNAEGGGSCFHLHLPARGFTETLPGGL